MGVLSGLLGPLFNIVDKLVPDKAAAAAQKAQLAQLVQSQEGQEIDDQFKEAIAGLDVVKAEAQGTSWLQRNWRPITMLIFVGLITARVFGYTSPNLSPSEYLELWGLMKLGLGGYVIGRSAEKIVSTAGPALKGVLGK